MKSIIAALVLTLAATGAAFAQGAATEWLTDHPAALKQAKEQKKPLFMFFTGSDWCGWCKKLQAEVLNQSEFQAYAKDKLVMLEVDFPRAKEQDKKVKDQNQALQTQYAIEGYPTVVLLDSEGKEKGKLGYMQGGPKAFIAELEKTLK